MSGRPPAKCIVCQVNRVAWTKPRVDFCYECLPGGPFAAPACRRCGSDRYFSDGLCDVCHPGGPLYLGSCRGCLAWGVYRAYSWRCWNCRWWRTHYPEGECDFCGRITTIAESGACRLCFEQARMLQEPNRAVDLEEANRFGQQLFFANMQGHRRGPTLSTREYQALRRRRIRLAEPSRNLRKLPLPKLARVERGQVFSPLPWRQLVLFEVDLDPAAVKERAGAVDSALLRYCDEVVRDHAERHGWTTKQTNDVRRSLRLLEVIQDTPGAKFAATDVLKLSSLQGNVNVSAESTLEVLAAAGLLVDDRVSPIERYFLKKTAGLPGPMSAQLRTWFEVMTEGSKKAPRRHARDPQTARLQIRSIAPILRAWADDGHETLAEIGRDDVIAALPEGGPSRHLAEQGLRSLFRVLKSRKAVFLDPTAGMALTPTNNNIPLPLDTAAIAAALDSPDRAAALAVALVAFHALTGRQVRRLELTDISDGRLALDGRVIPLAGPVLPRLSAWLDHRARTWPATINPHLFVNRRTAPRLTEVSRSFPWRQGNLQAQKLREDRILDEVHATGGDVRQICALFGLSVEGALRYVSTLDRTDLIDADSGSRTDGWN